MHIHELVAEITEQKQQRAQAVDILYTITDQPYRWSVNFLVEGEVYIVDILHRDEDVKDAHCTYCQTNDCIHVKAAYIAVAQQLAEQAFYNVEVELEPYSKSELIHMLALLHDEQEDLLTRFLQPDSYSKQQAYTMIDAALNNVKGWIDEEREDEAFAGLQQVVSNAQWLFKKEPFLAIQHLLACLERVYSIGARCDEDVHHITSVILDTHLQSFLDAITDKQLAQMVTEEIIHTIHACAPFPLQPVPMDCLFYSVIHLNGVSKMKQVIVDVIEQYKGILIEEGRYRQYIEDLS